MPVEQSKTRLATGHLACTQSIPAAAARAWGRCFLYLPLLVGLVVSACNGDDSDAKQDVLPGDPDDDSSGCNGDDSDAKQDVLPGDLQEDFWKLSEASYQFELKLCECDDWSCLSRLSEARWQAEMQCFHDGGLKYPELLREYVDCWLPINEEAAACAGISARSTVSTRVPGMGHFAGSSLLKAESARRICR